jgi:hypothetical protein
MRVTASASRRPRLVSTIRPSAQASGRASPSATTAGAVARPAGLRTPTGHPSASLISSMTCSSRRSVAPRTSLAWPGLSPAAILAP